MKPPLLFRRALGRDAKMLTGIAFAAKQHWGYPDEWMAEWRNELTVTPHFLRSQPVYVAKQSGRIIGFFGLKREKQEHFLEHLWLRPAHIGQGKGRLLFAEAVRHAKTAGAAELKIKSDPHAEPFYLTDDYLKK